MSWVETDDGWINLDHVGKIEADGPSYRFYGPGGVCWGKTARKTFNPDLALASYVPAAPSAWAYIVTVLYVDECPKMADIEVTQTSIVAWRIVNGDAEPVFHEGMSSEDAYLIPMPDGCLLHRGLYRFSDLLSAKEEILREAVADWRQSAKLEPATKDRLQPRG